MTCTEKDDFCGETELRSNMQTGKRENQTVRVIEAEEQM